MRVIKCTSRDNPRPPEEYLRTSGGVFHDMPSTPPAVKSSPHLHLPLWTGIFHDMLSHDFDMIHFLTSEIPDEVPSVLNY